MPWSAPSSNAAAPLSAASQPTLRAFFTTPRWLETVDDGRRMTNASTSVRHDRGPCRGRRACGRGGRVWSELDLVDADPVDAHPVDPESVDPEAVDTESDGATGAARRRQLPG